MLYSRNLEANMILAYPRKPMDPSETLGIFLCEVPLVNYVSSELSKLSEDPPSKAAIVARDLVDCSADVI